MMDLGIGEAVPDVVIEIATWIRPTTTPGKSARERRSSGRPICFSSFRVCANASRGGIDVRELARTGVRRTGQEYKMTVGGELCVAGVFSGNPECNAEGLYTEDRNPGLGLGQRILPVWAEPQPAKVLAPGGRGAGPPRRGGRGAGIRTVPRGCARWKGLRKQRLAKPAHKTKRGSA